eukprot:TRINITY_DN16629_c0_g1_i1.p1 TRINITY_DN16629_c0_g1~~TRINITY_DN16629_c0_g1_i1.p1  ORF type:complete len:213 (+),score=58.07 TRINITY_DN16629_c0_g1_i1:74-712(+)
MCIRDRYQRRVRGDANWHANCQQMSADALCIVGTKLIGNQASTDLAQTADVLAAHGVLPPHTLHSDDGNNLAAILNAIAVLAASDSPLSFVYYSGHGVSKRDARLGGWVIGPGAAQDDVHIVDMVDMPDVLITPALFIAHWNEHRSSPRKRCVLLLDSCYSSQWVHECSELRDIEARRCPMSDATVMGTYVRLAVERLSFEEKRAALLRGVR